MSNVKTKGHPTPYLKALEVHNDPDGRAWYIVVLGSSQHGKYDCILDVLDFGPDWVQVAKAKENADLPYRPYWTRWEDLGPFYIALDGDPM
jgi:hypothetical protein